MENKNNTIMSYIFMDTEHLPTLIYELFKKNGSYFTLIGFPSDCKTMMQNNEVILNVNTIEQAIEEYSKPEYFMQIVGNHLIEYWGATQEKAFELLTQIALQDFDTITQYEFVNYLNKPSVFRLAKR